MIRVQAVSPFFDKAAIMCKAGEVVEQVQVAYEDVPEDHEDVPEVEERITFSFVAVQVGDADEVAFVPMQTSTLNDLN